ncbi:hypothetical protein EDD36DRAFT_442584 [Exophiala viscosa]|uniref:Uncharacterized protein n=1 Tax=Exophiala viscosa TaxID=2486360 RepID=A0AAN6DSV1_9EURO|nr:hypothetical protein EDD36DRAFT_442584 [Exophiala viscosa]
MENIRQKLKRRVSHKDPERTYTSTSLHLTRYSLQLLILLLTHSSSLHQAVLLLCLPCLHTNKVTANFDENDSADEDTVTYVNKEADDAEKDGHSQGRPGTFLHRLISHGNKKTEDQLAREAAAANPEAGSADRVVTQR